MMNLIVEAVVIAFGVGAIVTMHLLHITKTADVKVQLQHMPNNRR